MVCALPAAAVKAALSDLSSLGRLGFATVVGEGDFLLGPRVGEGLLLLADEAADAACCWATDSELLRRCHGKTIVPSSWRGGPRDRGGV